MNFLKKNKFIVLLLFIVFILRLPTLFEPNWYGDEGIYLTVGMAVRKGFLLYRDIFDNKPPLIYILTALANGRQFWFRFFLSASLLTTIYFFYQWSLLFFANQKNKARLATILLAGLTTIRFLEGGVANAELFILLPVILGFYFFFKYYSKEKKSLLFPFIVGIFFSLGFLYKATGLFDFLAFGVYLFLFEKKKITITKKELLILGGFFSPILVTGLFFWFKNSFYEFFSSSFLQMLGYLNSWEAGTHSFSLVRLLKSELAIKFGLLAIIVFLLWLRKKTLSKTLIFASIWFVFCLYGATLSGRPYPHYLVQIIPPLCFLITIVFEKKENKIFLIPIGLLHLLIIAFFHYQFWHYSTIPYYGNFINFALGNKTKTDYFNYFGWEMTDLYNTAETIAANSTENDKLFVWADEPNLYPLTKRLPATPYLTAYHIKDLKYLPQTAQLLNESPPAIIVVKTNSGSFPQLETLLTENYFNIENVGNFNIYRLRIISP